MLALLEVGAVALDSRLRSSRQPGRQPFVRRFRRGDARSALAGAVFRRLLLLIGFGAKLGLLPFYEWFPGAYGSGSGATGAFLSGVILNAAFFSLSRCFVEWLPATHGLSVSLPGIFIVAIAVVSAILTALYAFQEEGWRELLSLSSAENGSIAVCLLGAALMFRQDGLVDLAGLAWTVALLHLAGHALAKGALFLTADGVYRAVGRLRSRPIRNIAAQSVALRAGRAVRGDEPGGHASAGRICQRMVFVSDFLPGVPSVESREPSCGCACRRGLGAHRRGRLCDLHQSVRDRAARPQAQTRRKACRGRTAVAVGALGFLVLALAVGMPVWLSGLEAAVSAAFSARRAARHARRLAARAIDLQIRVHLAKQAGYRHAAAGDVADRLVLLTAAGKCARAGLVRRRERGRRRARRRRR